MPKSIIINPDEVRKPGSLKFRDIKLNQYKKNFEKEEKKYGKATLKQVLSDMLLIREFESCLNQIKIQGSYQGIEYNHLGPAHLSMGQEAAAVGQSLSLDIDDFIFGSHRSHGEVLAKCFSAASKLSDDTLENIMTTYLDGKILQALNPDQNQSTNERAYDFILYGVLAEIFAKETGFN